ncbi:DNA polymerase beta superfamily protein [Paraflavitalea speifideaquila]|uniref:DNA polymerase beta superfamily protein n=1 Tax=Paraflavitalea speifideaquila TaxID=3076558 RepID=UPI0028EC9422|nr:nucleotidyltransferase domain-containing protein [Paraflavitalea speifideiaquila]
MLAAKWCLERNTIAPMTIGPLMELLPPDLHKEVSRLITLKAAAAESFVINISTRLITYITQQLFGIDLHSKELERDHFSVDKLDDFFIKTIKQYDY